MPQIEVEIILMRQLASTLAMPIFIVDPAGHLVFYNERAEEILGSKYQETGEMPMEEWSRVYAPVDEEGRPINPEDLPLVKAFTYHRAYHSGFWINALDGVKRYIEVTAIPLIGQRDKLIGAVAIFWETKR
jgi:PAS domain-containing protein